MEFTHFTHMPIVDGHIHFPYPDLMDDLLDVMDSAGVARANLVSVPDLTFVNQNAALIHFKAHHPDRA